MNTGIDALLFLKFILFSLFSNKINRIIMILFLFHTEKCFRLFYALIKNGTESETF